jgi:hypothetical protein
VRSARDLHAFQIAATPRQLAAFVAVSLGATSVYLLVVGLVTAVIPNPLFERMTPVTAANLIFWLAPALLFGPLIASYFVAIVPAACDVGNRTMAGGLLSFLAVGCPLCNKVVVLLLGASGAMTYFEPIQPLLGLGAMALLAYAVWLRFTIPQHGGNT